MNAKNNPNMNKISQIIQMSQNYASHKKMISRAKSCIDQSSLQRNKYHKKLLHQHQKYVDAVQKLKNKSLNESNRKFTQKILQVSKPVSKKQVIQQNSQSITSRSFWNLKIAKDRKRYVDNKSIHSLNQQMSERISKSRSKLDYGLNSYQRQKTQIKKDLNVSSQFSERSRTVLQNLVYKNLNINATDIPFLPHLSKRYRNQHPKKDKILRPFLSKQKQTCLSFS